MCDSITGNDERETYCRKLGHELRFAYCRTTDGDTVCPKILDCWFERFDVAGFMCEHYPKHHVEALTEPPAPKAVSLYELIVRAQQSGAGAEEAKRP